MVQNKVRGVLCPNCRKLVSSDEPVCPHCGQPGPGAWWRNNRFTHGFLYADQAVRMIIWANVAMFLISLLINPFHMRLTMNPLGLLSPNTNVLIALGATGTLPINRFHEWWSVISANYLHGGLLHILFNMIALRQLAPFVIREFGAYRMFIIYTLSGMFGFAVSYLAGVQLTLGASAAICGLIGASLYYGKSRGGPYGQAIYRQVAGWVAGLFLFGFMFPGIDNWAHGGGIIGGIGLGYLFGYNDRARETIAHKYLGIGLAGVTALTLSYAVVLALYYRFLA
jgi:membrane associated rhomboid family serine protease